MDSSNLDPATAQQLTRAVRVRLAWFGRLRRHMELRGFPPSDALCIGVSKCYDAALALHVRAHYASGVVDFVLVISIAPRAGGRVLPSCSYRGGEPSH